MAVSIGNIRSTWANTSAVYTGIGMNVNTSVYGSEQSLVRVWNNQAQRFRVTANGDLEIHGNITANGIISGITGTSGPLFAHANAAFFQANQAFAAANSAGGGTVGAAFGQANQAFNQANISFTYANTGQTWSGVAFSQANQGFAQGNTATVYSQASFARANLAFSQANQAFAQANTGGSYAPAYLQANLAFSQANQAFIQANTAITWGQAAYGRGNVAFNQANVAFSYANAAQTWSGAAFTQANTAATWAGAAFGQANQAFAQANTGGSYAPAYLQANLAFSQANQAFNRVNTVYERTNTSAYAGFAKVITTSRTMTTWPVGLAYQSNEDRLWIFRTVTPGHTLALTSANVDSRIECFYTDDNGITKQGLRTVYADNVKRALAGCAFGNMANGRIGGIVAATANSTTITDREMVFVYTDDNCSTFSTSTLPGLTEEHFPYGMLMSLPSAYGGDDANGFCVVTYGGTNSAKIVKTGDNGDNWTEATLKSADGTLALVQEPALVFTSAGAILFARGANNLFAATSSNLNTWSAWTDTGVTLGANPIHAVVDDDRVHIAICDREDFSLSIDENTMRTYVIDGPTLYANLNSLSSVTPKREWNLANRGIAYLQSLKVGSEWYHALKYRESASTSRPASGDLVLITTTPSAVPSYITNHSARQILQNPDFSRWSNGNVFTNLTTSAMTADRWQFNPSGANGEISLIPLNEVESLMFPHRPRYGLRIDTANTGRTHSDFAGIIQYNYGQQFYDLLRVIQSNQELDIIVYGKGAPIPTARFGCYIETGTGGSADVSASASLSPAFTANNGTYVQTGRILFPSVGDLTIGTNPHIRLYLDCSSSLTPYIANITGVFAYAGIAPDEPEIVDAITSSIQIDFAEDSTGNTLLKSIFTKANNALANVSGALFAGNLNVAGNVNSTNDYLKNGVKITPWVDVRTDFNVRGNGTTNESANLQAAFANTTATGNGWIVLSAGSAASYNLTSNVTPALANIRVSINPSIRFTGPGILRFDSMIPYQITPTFAHEFISRKYDTTWAPYFNIFQQASVAIAELPSTAVVAQFGEGVANVASAAAWGGNFVVVGNANNASAIASEINPVNLHPGASVFGVVIAAAGANTVKNAIQIQTNTVPLEDGIVFNDYLKAVSNSVIKAAGSTAKRGLDFVGSVFTEAAIGLQNNESIKWTRSGDSALVSVLSHDSSNVTVLSGDVGIRLDKPVIVANSGVPLISGQLKQSLQVHGTLTANSSMALGRWVSGTGGPGIVFTKSRGAAPGTHTIVQNNDNLGFINFYGSNGVSDLDSAGIHGYVNGAPGAAAMPGALLFLTSANGAATLVEHMRIINTGNVGIGTAIPANKLQVAGTVNANAYLINGDDIFHRVSVMEYGAVGNNSTDDTAAINAAIAALNAVSRTVKASLYFPPGTYKITSALTPITREGTIIEGEFRSSILAPNGTFSPMFTVGGTATNLYYIIVRDLFISGSNHTGTLFSLDNLSHTVFSNVMADQGYNIMYLRQWNNLTLEDFTCQNIRGEYGIKAYGSNATRNSRTDRGDVINMDRVILAGNNDVDVAHVNNCKLMHLDGFVASIYINKVQLLKGNTCIKVENTSGGGFGEWCQFIQGQNLDLEFPYYRLIDADHLEGFNIVNLYAHGTGANVGCYFGNNTSGIRLTNGKISGCEREGLYLLGAKGVSLTNIDVYNNSTGSSGTYDGIYVGANTNGFQMVNGSAGKAAHFSYTETQRYGINFAAGHVRSQLVGVRLNGNVTGTYTGTPNTTAALITT